MKKVLCVGMAVMDIPLRPVDPAIFTRDFSRIEASAWTTGGDAANVAVTLAKLGADVSLCAMLGRDPAGDFVVQHLAECGVNTRAIVRHPSLGTGVSHILVMPGGERHFLVSCDINDVLDFQHVPDESIREADIVYLGSAMYLRAMDQGGSAALFRRAHELGKLTMSDFGDPGDYQDGEMLDLLTPMLRETDIILPSYQEAVKISGETELPRIRDKLSGFGIRLLVVKLGAEGSYLSDFKDEWRIPTFEEFTPVDTTGAGDSFVGGFIRALLEGWDARRAVLFGSCVASHNITKVGATDGVPDFDTVYRYLSAQARFA
ncbi:MAG: carbohydrate kinase family protein [Treponema sp.]|jgi:sugar/nucleoside kinase (ribokinase family)|nr:carbohydrate kinase family protein [Treponema sp.]